LSSEKKIWLLLGFTATPVASFEKAVVLQVANRLPDVVD
jgi:hypothetical protein